MINCFICGSWIKPNKEGEYKCPKCKATWRKEKDGTMTRVYESYEDYVED